MSRQSLIHYDAMMESEKAVVSEKLNAAVHAARSREEDSDDSDADAEVEEYETAFEIAAIMEQRRRGKRREFKVRWKPCKENAFSTEELTWEPEETLRDDGNARMLSTWLRRQRRSKR